MAHKLKALALIGLLAASVPTSATVLEFSYSFTTGDVLSGTIDGTPVGDDVFGVALLGASFSGDPSLVFHPVLTENTVTFSGTGLRFGTPPPDPINGRAAFALVEQTGVAIVDPLPWLVWEQYDRTRWQLRSIAAPEPGTLALLGLGLAGLGLSRRRLAA